MHSPVFAYDREQGASLLVVVILIGMINVLVFALKSRLDKYLELRRNERNTEEMAAVANYLATVTDCKRTLAPYTRTNRCPTGTSISLAMVGREALPASSSEAPIAVGGQWKSHIVCGEKDLRVYIAKYSGSGSSPDALPLLGDKPLVDRSRQITDHAAAKAKICPEYFDVGHISNRLFTMTNDTAMYAAAGLDGDGKYVDGPPHCDGRIGKLADWVNSPPTGICFKQGKPSNFALGCVSVRSTFENAIYNRVTNLNQPTLLKYNDMRPRRAIESHNMNKSTCHRICRIKGYGAGRMTKCLAAGTATFSPPFGTIVADRSDSEVTCICMK